MTKERDARRGMVPNLGHVPGPAVRPVRASGQPGGGVRVTETCTRPCCMPQDLVPDLAHLERIHPDSPPHSWNFLRYQVCRHCGQRYEYESFVDAAGSRDWHYRLLK